MQAHTWMRIAIPALVTALAIGCGDDGGGSGGGDTDADSDADTDSDAGTDTDADSDADSDTDTDTDTGPENYWEAFTHYLVDDTLQGPAYVSVGDVDGDDQPDLVVSAFGPLSDMQMRGSIAWYEFDGDLDTWLRSDVVSQSTTLKFPNQTTLRDVDGDDDLDIVAPAGFLACATTSGCGALAWFEQDGSDWVRHDIVPFGADLFFHEALFADLDDDDIADLITVGEEKGSSLIGPDPPDQAVPGWFKGTGSGDQFETTPRVIGEGLGGIPFLHDIDGDDDLDILSSEYFVAGVFDQYSFAWMEQVETPSVDDPAGVWTRHVIADDVGPAIMFALVPDLYGDEVLRGVGANHTNINDDEPESAVYAFDIPSDPVTSPWDKELISEGIESVPSSMFSVMGAPGIFGWGDVDGDGDIDIAVSGDGDKRVFVLEQVAPGAFATRILAEEMGQAGGMKVTDLDDDGHAEIVFTSYEQHVIHVYEWSW